MRQNSKVRKTKKRQMRALTICEQATANVVHASIQSCANTSPEMIKVSMLLDHDLFDLKESGRKKTSKCPDQEPRDGGGTANQGAC